MSKNMVREFSWVTKVGKSIYEIGKIVCATGTDGRSFWHLLLCGKSILGENNVIHEGKLIMRGKEHEDRIQPNFHIYFSIY